MEKIPTTVRLKPETVVLLNEGLTRNAYGNFRSPAGVIIAACDTLAEIYRNAYPDLQNLTSEEIAGKLLKINSLDNHVAAKAAASLLSEPSKTWGEKLSEEKQTMNENDVKKADFTIPKNFLHSSEKA